MTFDYDGGWNKTLNVISKIESEKITGNGSTRYANTVLYSDPEYEIRINPG